MLWLVLTVPAACMTLAAGGAALRVAIQNRRNSGPVPDGRAVVPATPTTVEPIRPNETFGSMFKAPPVIENVGSVSLDDRYRDALRRFHPDRYTDPAEKEACAHFIGELNGAMKSGNRFEASRILEKEPV